MRKLIALLLVLGTGCATCFAGNGANQKNTEKIRNQVSKYLEKGRMVSVETYDQHKRWGRIDEAGPETFTLSVAGNLICLHYTDVKKIKAPMDPATKSRIIVGFVVAGLTGLTLIAASQDK